MSDKASRAQALREKVCDALYSIRMADDERLFVASAIVDANEYTTAVMLMANQLPSREERMLLLAHALMGEVRSAIECCPEAPEGDIADRPEIRYAAKQSVMMHFLLLVTRILDDPEFHYAIGFATFPVVAEKWSGPRPGSPFEPQFYLASRASMSPETAANIARCAADSGGVPR